jgi:hypothetical protein
MFYNSVMMNKRWIVDCTHYRLFFVHTSGDILGSREVENMYTSICTRLTIYIINIIILHCTLHK